MLKIWKDTGGQSAPATAISAQKVKEKIFHSQHGLEIKLPWQIYIGFTR